MYNHIWGNVYLYCWEHGIDFREIYYKLIETEWKAYQEVSEELHIPLKYGKNQPFNKLIGSTMEVDINVLTSCFNIPIEEIFAPLNYTERLIKLLESVKEDFWMDEDKGEFYHLNNAIEFIFEYDDGILFRGDLCVTYIFSKYFNEKTLTFCYNLSVNFRPGQLKTLHTNNGSVFMAFHSMKCSIPHIEICLYDGDSGCVANYFNREMKYKKFVEYKYKSGIIRNVEHRMQTNEVISEISINDYKILDFKDIIVKSAVKKCDNPEHETKIINGIFFIMIRKTGEIKKQIVPVVYCSKCNVYFIYDYEYKALCMKGQLLCKIHNRLRKNDTNNAFSHLSIESIFKICGYTVDANEGMSSQARHNILKFLINRKIVTVLQTLNFLQWLINSRKNNSNMCYAVKKWEEDFEYINEEYIDHTQNAIIT